MFRLSQLSDAAGRIAEDGDNAGRVVVNEDESITVDAIIALPPDGEVGIGFLEVDRLGIAVPCQTGGEVIGRVQEPGVAGISRKQRQWAAVTRRASYAAAQRWM